MKLSTYFLLGVITGMVSAPVQRLVDCMLDKGSCHTTQQVDHRPVQPPVAPKQSPNVSGAVEHAELRVLAADTEVLTNSFKPSFHLGSPVGAD
ncbi:MAG: hypothetical protein FWD62_05365 [Betaproteobacteria bacterium]|nr:hypothetical protein [Betaproteobacteria bacterium]